MDQLSAWRNEVVRLAVKDPANYKTHAKTKRLATLEKLVFEVIPSVPGNKLWLLGNSLGEENRAWRRAKFHQQFRLFFRFDQRSKIIIYGFINDENSMRARGKKTDAYLVFQKMLERGSPPTEWAELLVAAKSFERELI